MQRAPRFIACMVENAFDLRVTAAHTDFRHEIGEAFTVRNEARCPAFAEAAKIKVNWIAYRGGGPTLLAVAGGQWIHGTRLESLLTLGGTSLAWWIMGYGLVASVLPVWLLLALCVVSRCAMKKNWRTI